MWLKAKFRRTTLAPDRDPLNRRIYEGAKKLVRSVLLAGGVVLLPVLGVIALKGVIALVWMLLGFLLKVLLSSTGNFGDFFARSISHMLDSIQTTPSLWWLIAGAAITWWPLIRSR